MVFRTFILTIKMIYNFMRYLFILISFLFNTFWFCGALVSVLIPWLTLLILIICIASKIFKLPSPNEKTLLNLLHGDNIDDISYWPIANRGGAYDAPENSLAALKKCSKHGFRNILLDADITSCGRIVICHKQTLEKVGINGNICEISFDKLQDINISELHPLGSQYDPEKIITLDDLLTLLETVNLTIFLLISNTKPDALEKLKQTIRTNENLTQRIIICSSSPYAIYQLRKEFPNLVCGLWTKKLPSRIMLKTSALLNSIYGVIVRNVISPVIGISLVFISKDEFNQQISELWRNVGVRPIVYNVNSPNEKRYFQKIMKTQYLTDSLRSEPQLYIKT